MRLIFLMLLLANVAAFGYIRYAESRAGADAQIALLQISPEKLKLLPKTAQRAQPQLVCLEWGSFTADDTTRASVALAKFGLGDKVTQRDGGNSYWVYIPPLKTKAEAEKKVAEVRAFGISDTSVVLDNDQWQFAVSLGAFKTERRAFGGGRTAPYDRHRIRHP